MHIIVHIINLSSAAFQTCPMLDIGFWKYNDIIFRLKLNYSVVTITLSKNNFDLRTDRDLCVFRK